MPFFQREVKQLLRHNLSRLPKPKNDFEIVLPETNDPSANEEEKMDASTGRVEDQADIDRRKREEKRRQGMFYLDRGKFFKLIS